VLGGRGIAHRYKSARPSGAPHKLCTGDVVGEVFAMRERDDSALRRVQDQRRCLQGRECGSHVGLQECSPQSAGCPRSEGGTPHPR